MKKILLSGMLFLGLGANAQLADGSVAPDFTLTDINGTVHHLYAYLDAGKTVVLDISATWCGPCWNYHNTGALENLWVDHGPAGGTNVSPSTTDDVIVILIEGDGTTNSADLHGTGTNTQGDWTAGTSHPIIDPATAQINAFNTAYGIAYFPTCYKICPNRLIEGVDQQTEAQIYAKVTACPAPASSAVDVMAQSYTGLGVTCAGADYTPSVKIMNNSTTTLTSATVTITQGGNTVSTGTYSGSLATYGMATVTCSPITNFAGGSLTVTVTTSGDAVSSNNGLTTSVSLASATGTNNTVVVKTSTDHYGSETTWAIKDMAGVVKAHGGPYANGTANQTYPQADVTANLPNGCYYLEVNDAYGDGFTGAYGNGSVEVTVNGTTLVGVTSLTSSYASVGFKIAAVSGVEELELADFMVYPNPATDKLNVNFTAENTDYTVAITDVAGRVLTSNTYSNISGSQNIEVSLAGITAGNYIVTVSCENGAYNKKVVIK